MSWDIAPRKLAPARSLIDRVPNTALSIIVRLYAGQASGFSGIFKAIDGVFSRWFDSFPRDTAAHSCNFGHWCAIPREFGNTARVDLPSATWHPILWRSCDDYLILLKHVNINLVLFSRSSTPSNSQISTLQLTTMIQIIITHLLPLCCFILKTLAGSTD